MSSVETRKSEFGQIGLLPDTYLTINALDVQPDPVEVGRQIGSKIAGALLPLVKSLLSQSAGGNVLDSIQALASKIESAQYSHYLRAGRNHVEIRHSLGLEGNMFFKTAFDIVLGRGTYHAVVQENSICVVFRIGSLL